MYSSRTSIHNAGRRRRCAVLRGARAAAAAAADLAEPAGDLMRLLCACVWWACAVLAAVYAQQDALFTISIDIGGEQPEELPVRDGDVPSRLAEAFAQKHGLNDRGAHRTSASGTPAAAVA